MAPKLDLTDVLAAALAGQDASELRSALGRGVDLHAPAFASAEGSLSSLGEDDASANSRVDSIVSALKSSA